MQLGMIDAALSALMPTGDNYEGNVGITMGDVEVNIGLGSQVYDVVGGSWVGCGAAHNNVVQQGNITVNLGKGATILGNVYAGGIQSGEVALTAESTTVDIRNGVTFAPGAIVSGGFLSANHQETETERDAFSSWRDNASRVKGDRTLKFSDAEDYEESLAEVIFTNFDVVEVSAEKVKVGALLLTDTQGGSRSAVTITGGGQLSIVPGEMSITTQQLQEDGTLTAVEQPLPNLASAVVTGEKTTLHLAVSESAESVGKVEKVAVTQGGTLAVDLVAADGSRRELEVADSLSFSEGGILDMHIKVESDKAEEAFIRKAAGGTKSSTMLLDGAQISLTLDNHSSAEIVNANGEVYVVLVDKVVGGTKDYTLTALTQEMLARLFTEEENVSVIVDEDGHLVLSNVEESIVKPVTPNEHYYEQRSLSVNGASGGVLFNEYFYGLEEGQETPDRGKALESALRSNAAGKAAESDRLQAAVAGASLASLGAAAADDLERQLRLVRNRVQRPAEVEDGQRRMVWVNAEGDHRTLDAKGTDPGYKMNSWGGTLGMGYTTRKNIDLGLALTAMYGDHKSDGPDKLKADADTCYLSGFAQVKRGKWTHTFVATAGLTNLDGTRTVDVGNGFGSYSTEFETDGYLLGVMYEVGRSIYLNEDHTTYLQPIANAAWRHVDIDGFTESGSDAALRTADQRLDSVTLGAGVRLGGQAGRRTLNRSVQLEGRALVKSYLGDTQNKVEVGFADRAARAKVQSREQSKVGVELGGSATLPLSSHSRKAHALFMDANAELRGDYTNLNATLGYKVQF